MLLYVIFKIKLFIKFMILIPSQKSQKVHLIIKKGNLRKNIASNFSLYSQHLAPKLTTRKQTRFHISNAFSSRCLFTSLCVNPCFSSSQCPLARTIQRTWMDICHLTITITRITRKIADITVKEMGILRRLTVRQTLMQNAPVMWKRLRVERVN